MDTLTITKPLLEAVLLRWALDARDGKTRSHDETDALPVEQVAAESAEHLWRLLNDEPQDIEGLLKHDLAKPMAEAIFPSSQLVTGDGRS